MYYVIVKTSDKEVRKPFETEQEAFTFATQALQLKVADPGLTVKVRMDYGDGHLYVVNQKEQVPPPKGMPVLSNVRPIRKAVPMAKRLNHIFCTNCGFYTKLVDLDYAKGCRECGMTVNDFDMKTANGMWEKVH